MEKYFERQALVLTFDMCPRQILRNFTVLIKTITNPCPIKDITDHKFMVFFTFSVSFGRRHPDPVVETRYVFLTNVSVMWNDGVNPLLK